MTRQGRSRLAVLLGSACLLAAVLAAAPFVAPPPVPSLGAALDAQPRLDLANLSLPPLDAFPETTRRPLFSTTRSPAAALAVQAGGRDGLILGRYALVGTVVTPRQRIVLLRPAAGGAVLRLKEGDALDSWRIEKISAEALVLRDGGRSETVTLRGPQK